MLKKWIVAVAGVGLLCGQVAAAPATEQEQKAACTEEAGKKGLKGEERKRFMGDCLSAKKVAQVKVTAQQEKMKACNQEAGRKELKGEARKKFMSECLSAKN
jgi:hypothetical protein